MTSEEKAFKENRNTSYGEDARKSAPKFMGKALDFAHKLERFFLYSGMFLTAWTFLIVLFTVLAVA